MTSNKRAQLICKCKFDEIWYFTSIKHPSSLKWTLTRYVVTGTSRFMLLMSHTHLLRIINQRSESDIIYSLNKSWVHRDDERFCNESSRIPHPKTQIRLVIGCGSDGNYFHDGNVGMYRLHNAWEIRGTRVLTLYEVEVAIR